MVDPVCGMTVEVDAAVDDARLDLYSLELASIWRLALIPRQVRAIGYAERDDDLLIRTGIFFQRTMAVPYGRMQYVDIGVGPVERGLGLCTLKLHTASPGTNAQIPGLPAAEGARLREQLAARGEARLAGL